MLAVGLASAQTPGSSPAPAGQPPSGGQGAAAAPSANGQPAADAKETRRHSAAVGRLLKRLHLRRLLAKIPHSHRWRVTPRGRHLLGDALLVYRRYWPQQFARAAS